MLKIIRRHLGWKIFLSYLIVLLVGFIVLATATEFTAPTAFDHHLAAMNDMMMGDTSMMGDATDLGLDLFTNFRNAVNEALGLALAAAFTAALVVSLIVSRQVVAPIRQMMFASQRIADGHYDERVDVPGDIAGDGVDELAQLALSFNQMATKLEYTEEMRRQLIGDVAHELRTPLTTIKGSIEGLMDGVLTSDAQTFQQIHRQADRLQRLIDDLQELSRVEAGAYEMNLLLREVQDLVEITKTTLIRQFEEKGVTLSIELDADLPMVYADEDRIGQVLLNLVGNALQYTPVEGVVTIRARREQDEVLISVSDTGVGLQAEHIEQIFTRFYRADSSRSRIVGGSGIGLTIAKHLTEAHGGRIWAESPGADQGSTFTFTLPTAG
ncbi:MAG: HAMP domain-containing sensor histidine kinase [Anaerolineales bacterium]|nr:MAG: HAMP domain-containing sensor histidine kinase [Anaerolineales bacterium]